jgi:hypothetical protein
MNRREFITLLGGAAASSASWPFAARAQQQAAGRLPLVAVLVGQSQATSSDWVSSLPQGLQELGYVEGRDLEIVYRYVDGDYLTRLPALVDELIKLKPQVVVTGSTTGILAINRAAPTIPIVGPALVDPVGLGLAASLARPGGQVTGIAQTLDTLPGKQLELVLQVMPGAKKDRIAGQHHPSDQQNYPAQRGDRRRRARGSAGAGRCARARRSRRRLPKIGGRARRERAGAAGRDVPERAATHCGAGGGERFSRRRTGFGPGLDERSASIIRSRLRSSAAV